MLKMRYPVEAFVILFMCSLSSFSGFVEYDNCGKIAFVSDREKMPQLFVIDADGSNLTQITADYSHNVEPCWSSDGTHILFASDRGGNYDIYVMDPDGSHIRQLTHDRQRDRAPVWSPDGEKIAFVRGGFGEEDIYVMDADGANQIDLTDSPGCYSDPSWSPDGKQIVFESGDNSICVVLQFFDTGLCCHRVVHNGTETGVISIL
jgi:Tol biopolymer transport system component